MQPKCFLLAEQRRTYQILPSPEPPSSGLTEDDLNGTTNIIENEIGEIQLIRPIDFTNNFIYLAWSCQRKSFVGMKIFPTKKGMSNVLYLNEKRFLSLKHPNIIQLFAAVEPKRIDLDSESSVTAGMILMELARCDFSKILEQTSFSKDEVLVRTYFHQLVNALEYLHSKGFCHLDLKPSNLLLGEDYNLKLGDFDLSSHQNDIVLISKGTENYRAPELLHQRCKKPMKSDMYSLGIILFSFMTKGRVPCTEKKDSNGSSTMESLLTNPEKYWEFLCSAFKKYNFSNSFKQLFLSLTQENPNNRPDFEDVKQSKWFLGPTYSPEELKNIMQPMISGHSIVKPHNFIQP